MTTVSNRPEAPKSISPKPHVTSGAGSAGYARPTAGGNATGDAAAPAGPTPGYSINKTGAPVSTGGTQTGPDVSNG